MRGRKPKPTERHISEGDPSKFGKNKLQQRLKTEPKASAELPPCPKHLKGRARSLWKFFSEELAVMKLSKRPDGPMLEGACEAYAKAVAADLILNKAGLVIETKYIDDAGEVHVLDIKKHPAVDISSKQWMIVKAFCSEFGFSPVSRMRLAVEKSTDDIQDLAQLLSQPRVRTEDGPTVH